MNIPWGIVLWSIVIPIILRPLIPSNPEFFLACLAGGFALGLISAMLEVKDEK